MNYRADIDGLRAVSIAFVLVFHAFPEFLPGGFIGVDVFFVISGFLISGIIFSELESRTFSFVNFLSRRVRRLFPALILVMATFLGIGSVSLLADEYAQLGKHVAGSAAFIVNFLLAAEEGYFNNSAYMKPMLHLWSLSVEEQFYLVWPFLLWSAWKRKINWALIIGLIFCISFASNIFLSGSNAAHAFFWPVGRFWELLSGAFLAWLTLYKYDALDRRLFLMDKYITRLVPAIARVSGSAVTANAMALLGLLILAFSAIQIDDGDGYPGTAALLPVSGAILIISVGSRAFLTRAILMSPVAVWVGLISYPLYLWHWPILSLLQIIEGPVPSVTLRLRCVLISVALAWLTYRFVERPLRYRFSPRTLAALLVVLMVFTGSAGYLIARNNGVTDANHALAEISNARLDWEYPGQLQIRELDDVRFVATSSADIEVIFLGDSHIEQYGPRVGDLYRKGMAKEVAFITGGGCPPIPDIVSTTHADCLNLLPKFEKIVRKNPVDTVVLGACFNCYLIRKDNYPYEFNDGQVMASLTTDEGIRRAKQSFYQFAERLAQEYRVVVLLDTPSGVGFSPATYLTSTKHNRSFFIRDTYVEPKPFDQNPQQQELDAEMARQLGAIGIETISQASTICPSGKCVPFDGAARPKYKDKDHMRPWFVRAHMSELDKFYLK